MKQIWHLIHDTRRLSHTSWYVVFSNWYPYPYWKLALPFMYGRVWTLVWWAWDFSSYHSGSSNFWTLQHLCPTLNLCLHSRYKHCLNPKPKMIIFSYYFRISHMGQDTNDTEWTPHFPHQIIDYVTKWPPCTWVAITNLFSPSMILLFFQIFAKFLHVCGTWILKKAIHLMPLKTRHYLP
jgi:hypothetical protein